MKTTLLHTGSEGMKTKTMKKENPSAGKQKVSNRISPVFLVVFLIFAVVLFSNVVSSDSAQSSYQKILLVFDSNKMDLTDPTSPPVNYNEILAWQAILDYRGDDYTTTTRSDFFAMNKTDIEADYYLVIAPCLKDINSTEEDFLAALNTSVLVAERLENQIDEVVAVDYVGGATCKGMNIRNSILNQHFPYNINTDIDTDNVWRPDGAQFVKFTTTDDMLVSFATDHNAVMIAGKVHGNNINIFMPANQLSTGNYFTIYSLGTCWLGSWKSGHRFGKVQLFNLLSNIVDLVQHQHFGTYLRHSYTPGGKAVVGIIAHDMYNNLVTQNTTFFYDKVKYASDNGIAYQMAIPTAQLRYNYTHHSREADTKESGAYPTPLSPSWVLPNYQTLDALPHTEFDVHGFKHHEVNHVPILDTRQVNPPSWWEVTNYDTLTSQSGNYHAGRMRSFWFDGSSMKQAYFIVTDNATSGVYDTLYIDQDGNFSTTDDQIVLKENDTFTQNGYSGLNITRKIVDISEDGKKVIIAIVDNNVDTEDNGNWTLEDLYQNATQAIIDSGLEFANGFAFPGWSDGDGSKSEAVENTIELLEGLGYKYIAGTGTPIIGSDYTIINQYNRSYTSFALPIYTETYLDDVIQSSYFPSNYEYFNKTSMYRFYVYTLAAYNHQDYINKLLLLGENIFYPYTHPFWEDENSNSNMMVDYLVNTSNTISLTLGDYMDYVYNLHKVKKEISVSGTEITINYTNTENEDVSITECLYAGSDIEFIKVDGDQIDNFRVIGNNVYFSLSIPANSNAIVNIKIGTPEHFKEFHIISLDETISVSKKLGISESYDEIIYENRNNESSTVVDTINLSSQYPIKKIEDGEFNETTFNVLIMTDYGKERIEEIIKNVSEVSDIKIKRFKEELQEKVAKTSEIQKKEKRLEPKIEVDFSAVQTIRVRREELDKLMNLVGELIINKIQLLRTSSEHKLDFLKTTLDNIDRLTSELQNLVMRIRMVPIGHIFNRFPRLVRDIARKLGKKVNFIMEGKEIEVDRTVLDEIGEPILHLLRNAIDHGIEPPNKREEIGKPPEGIVKLTAERKRDHILITVEDDGAGLDLEKIKRKALEKGVISEAEANAMTTQQLIDLIFLPGFSTSEKVTETSGRGVGMDIVKTKIEALGGNVQIESTPGKGTKVTLMLPLTLAIIKAILIKAANQTYAIPLSQIAEVIHIKKSELKKIGNVKAINLRGKVLPVFHLRRLLGNLELETENYTVVIINREPINFGLIVDSIVGMQEIVIKTLDESLKKIEGIAGVTILGDGQVVLILDPANLIAKKRRVNMF